MSTYLRSASHAPILSLADLENYFHSHRKPLTQHKIGIEWELFGNVRGTTRPLPYFGPAGIEKVLRSLSSRFGYQVMEEEGHAVALQRGQNFIALEPGGQLELSAEPVTTVHDVKAQLEGFKEELLKVSADIPVTWFTAGFHPFARPDELEWVPKKRYGIMKDYLSAKGDGAHDMMKRTAANQVSIDYADEGDAMGKLRVVYALTSLVSALFAHSPLSDACPNGYLNYRMRSWRLTDPDRTGLLPFFWEEGVSFQDYLDYVLDTPMIFIIRKGSWVPMEGMPFRDFLLKGHGGHRATMDDFELHLSTLFPEARIKNCIEIRGADGQLFEAIPAVPAFWKGVLYDKLARQECWDIMRGFSAEDRLHFHRDMEKRGLNAGMGRFRGWELMKQLAEASRWGLRAQRCLNQSGEDESTYLDLLFEKVIKPEKNPAEILIEKWNEIGSDRMKLIDYLSLS